MSAAPSFAARSAGVVLRGAPNFRDLGGYATRCGRHVRHGLVFRSGHLGHLEPQDIALLQAHLGEAVCVIDLRGAGERQAAACALPGAVVHSLPVEPTVARRLDVAVASGEPLTQELARGFMREAYHGFARNARPQLAAFFRHLSSGQAQPTVLHCAAGKDRTGFVCAMLLEALGVSRETVMGDYLHTNERLAPKEGGRFPPEVMQVLATVRAEFLDAAYDAIERDFGTVDAYLERAAGVTPAARERLGARFLSI